MSNRENLKRKATDKNKLLYNEDFLQYRDEIEVSSSPILFEDFGDALDPSSDEYFPSNENSSDEEIITDLSKKGPGKKNIAKNVDQNKILVINTPDPNPSNIVNDLNEESQIIKETTTAPSTNKKRGRKRVEGEGIRKRKRNCDSWAKNIQKKKKNSGEEYVTLKGKLISSKSMKPPCQCRKKCYEQFNDVERAAIFADYYSLSKEGKDQFLASNIKEEVKQRMRLRPESQPTRE